METSTEPIRTFCDNLVASADAGQFLRAVLAKFHGTPADLVRIDIRSVQLRGELHLQWVYHHRTRDLTRNTPLAEAGPALRALLGAAGFRDAHLFTRQGHHQLAITRKGHARLAFTADSGAADEVPDVMHNREKHRPLSLDRPFLAELGLTTADHRLVPAMARKWKQINRFIEVFADALAGSRMAETRQLRVIDFGSGKGYLTFALHDWLTQAQGRQAQVTGVELRADMVRLCGAVADRLGLQGLRFVEGDLQHWPPEPLNVMIALHACDTATDHAIDLGLRGGADIILCSPCCHKELRPQLLSPHPLRPILQHGVHLGQQAEMLTDGLRAMLLDAAGYDTQVFEFISLEHTNKNKMILAVKRAQARPAAPVLAQIAEIKSFYGIREQCLERLIAERLRSVEAGVADNPA